MTEVTKIYAVIESNEEGEFLCAAKFKQDAQAAPLVTTSKNNLPKLLQVMKMMVDAHPDKKLKLVEFSMPIILEQN